MKKFKKFSIIKHIKNNIYLYGVLLIGAFFRFYNVFNRYSFDSESIRDAGTAVYGASHLQFPLTGPFASIGPFTTGPLYWYQLIVANILFPFEYTSWFYITITSFLFVFIMYKIGETLEDKKFGITLAFLAAISPYILIFATALTNPTGIFLFAGLSIWIFLKIIKQKVSYWWGLGLGLCIGIGLSTHYQMAAYLLFALALCIVKRKNLGYFFSSLLGLFITYLPLLFFDLLNNWYELRTIIDSYIHLKDRVYVPNSWKLYLLHYWPESWSQILGVPLPIGIIILVGIGVVFGYMVWKKMISKELTVLSIIFFLMLLHLRYYMGVRFSGYIHYLVPLIFIYTGYLISKVSTLLKIPVLYPILLLIIAAFVLPQDIRQLGTYEANQRLHEFRTLLMHRYPTQSLTLYQCKGDTNEKLITLMYLLNDAKKLNNDNGVKIALENSHCLENIKKETSTPIKRIELANNTVVYEIGRTNDDVLESFGFEHYSMYYLYKISALWWFESKIK